MERLRAWWWNRQGLAASRTMAPAQVAREFGWLRSVGSANPYLAIHARTGASCAEIERSVAEVDLVELPAARGCTYYVAQEDAALALRLAAMGHGRAEFRMAERHLGVTESEIATLADWVRRALEAGPLDPRGLSPLVQPRSFGEAGKKRGMTSALPLALSHLQLEGAIRRLPQGGRLDTERFHYALWERGPRPTELDETEVARAMATRYFGWAGPATEREFRDFTGLPAKLAKEARVGLTNCPDDPQRWMRPEDVDVYLTSRPGEGRAILVSSLDPWLHLRRNHATLWEAEVLPPGGVGLTDLESHPVALDGEIVGMWEFDHAVQAIVAQTWKPGAEAVIRDTGAWIATELGDFRAFSLDSPKSRQGRIEALRG